MGVWCLNFVYCLLFWCLKDGPYERVYEHLWQHSPVRHCSYVTLRIAQKISWRNSRLEPLLREFAVLYPGDGISVRCWDPGSLGKWAAYLALIILRPIIWTLPMVVMVLWSCDDAVMHFVHHHGYLLLLWQTYYDPLREYDTSPIAILLKFRIPVGNILLQWPTKFHSVHCHTSPVNAGQMWDIHKALPWLLRSSF